MSQTAEQMSMQNLTRGCRWYQRRCPGTTVDFAQHMLRRLRDSVQTSRRFLADASHELRTPLTVIKGELQEIVGNHCGSGELRERIGSVLEEVARLEHLVSGLLALSRLDAGESAARMGGCGLGGTERSTAEQMRLMAEDRGIQLELSAAERTVIRGDPGSAQAGHRQSTGQCDPLHPRGGTVMLRTADSGRYGQRARGIGHRYRHSGRGGCRACSTGSFGWMKPARGTTAVRASGFRSRSPFARPMARRSRSIARSGAAAAFASSSRGCRSPGSVPARTASGRSPAQLACRPRSSRKSSASPSAAALPALPRCPTGAP